MGRRDRSPPHRDSRSPPHHRRLGSPHRRRDSRSPPRQGLPKDESFEQTCTPVNLQQKLFEWLKVQKHKNTWLITGRALLSAEGAVEGTELLGAEGSRILLQGF